MTSSQWSNSTIIGHFYPEWLWDILTCNPQTIKSVRLATFGLTQPYQLNFQSLRPGFIAKAMNQLNNLQLKPKAKILIGTPNNEVESRIFEDFQGYRKIALRSDPNSHLKCCLIERIDSKEGLLGGVNLTNSSWNDLMVRLTKKQFQDVKTYFDLCWKTFRGRRKT